MCRVLVCAWLILGAGVFAQTPSPIGARLAILQAEDRRASAAADLAVIRSGARSSDPQTARIGVRALGRLERPALIADIVPALRHPLPELRIEAATALGQAAQGWTHDRPAAANVDMLVATLGARLKIEADADVRAAIGETLGRIPYTTAAQVDGVERMLVDAAARTDAMADRLGAAKGLEALLRLSQKLRPPGDGAIAALRGLASSRAGEQATGVRVRRLAVDALGAADQLDGDALTTAAHDPDSQVRRLAVRAAGNPARSPAADRVIAVAMADESPIVRLEALRSVKMRRTDNACQAAAASVSDAVPSVALFAIDQLSGCGDRVEAVETLDKLIADPSIDKPRGWHRAAHAMVALASASPEHGARALAALSGSHVWQVRMYAARAAALLHDRASLERLATDEDDNVREAAIGGLKTVAGHDGDDVYVAQLTRPGYQVIRAAALALRESPHRELAEPALDAALRRLESEGRDNSHDARDAIANTLGAWGLTPNTHATTQKRGQTPATIGDMKRVDRARNDLAAEDLRRLAAPRALVTIRGVGTFELALFTAQAPATVLRFAHLAQAGYYNGLTFHRVVPNFVIQGGSPGANEYVGDASFMRDELGSWPHVRGAVGISTRGRDTGDAQIFVDLVDNPRLDHDYTVFAQVLNGIDVVDRILEGDTIEKIQILSR